MFSKSFKAVKEIIDTCRNCNIDVFPLAFNRNKEDIIRIVQLCRERNIKITSSLFLQTFDEFEK